LRELGSRLLETSVDGVAIVAGATIRILSGPLPAARRAVHNERMERATFQMTVGAMIAVVACIALNFWLFRLGVFWGILGLNVTKHVVIAYLCQVLGVDRRPAVQAPRVVPAPSPQVPVS
jgi:hypothetical protein